MYWLVAECRAKANPLSVKNPVGCLQGVEKGRHRLIVQTTQRADTSASSQGVDNLTRRAGPDKCAIDFGSAQLGKEAISSSLALEWPGQQAVRLTPCAGRRTFPLERRLDLARNPPPIIGQRSLVTPGRQLHPYPAGMARRHRRCCSQAGRRFPRRPDPPDVDRTRCWSNIGSRSSEVAERFR